MNAGFHCRKLVRLPLSYILTRDMSDIDIAMRRIRGDVPLFATTCYIHFIITDCKHFCSRMVGCVCPAGGLRVFSAPCASIAYQGEHPFRFGIVNL